MSYIFKCYAQCESSVERSTILAFPSFPRYTHAQPLMREIDQDEVSHASGSFSCKSSPRFAFLITSNGSVPGVSARTQISIFFHDYSCRRYSYRIETAFTHRHRPCNRITQKTKNDYWIPEIYNNSDNFYIYSPIKSAIRDARN